MDRYCGYIDEDCDEKITEKKSGVFVAYPSDPAYVSETIKQAVETSREGSNQKIISWEDLPVTGSIIFCEICKAIAKAEAVVADITTLNFNVMFELGYAIGLGKPVIPIRDDSYTRDQELFEEVAIFDVVGYQKFTHVDDLRRIFSATGQATPLKLREQSPSNVEPIYIVKSPHNSEASTRILSAIKKSAFYRFRAYDKSETPRLSLYDAYKQVSGSFGVVVHMIASEREGSRVHNAICAFVAGLSCALGRRTLMLQEGDERQPIDYRELIVHYKQMKTLNNALERFVRRVADAKIKGVPRASEGGGELEKVDLGDTAAENEITALPSYFIRTPQFQQAKQGHARLVVGRKGSGKTANFYAVREAIRNKRSLIIDLKPDGDHFTKLRDQVLQHLKEGVQLHTLTSFWGYLLLLEVAKKLIDRERGGAWHDQERLERFRELEEEYNEHCLDIEGDFSERIMGLVTNISSRLPLSKVKDGVLKNNDITEMIYQQDIKNLKSLIISHLDPYEDVWLLFDNIDKGWSSFGATIADVAIVRSLLEGTRKLQRDLDHAGIDFRSIVFLRQDIYSLLENQTPDRGKESVANLDWTDRSLLEEMLRKRFVKNEAVADGPFRDIWSRYFDAHVGGTDTFGYILERSLYQPRAVLNFVTKSIQVGVGRGHSIVSESDVLAAEKAFSEDMLRNLHFEIRDIAPHFDGVVHGFIGYVKKLSREDIFLVASEIGVSEDKFEELLQILLWFSFIGVVANGEERFSYESAYDLPKLLARNRGIHPENQRFVIHPAYHKALELE